MSQSIESDVVPFVAHGVAEFQDRWEFSAVPEKIQLLLSVERWAEERAVDVGVLTKFGWTFDVADREFIGKHGRLFGERWRKGEHSVWLVNEDQYASVGEYYMSVCGNTREALEAFESDWDIDYDYIEEMDSVEQAM